MQFMNLGAGQLEKLLTRSGKVTDHVHYDAEHGRLISTNRSALAVCHVIPTEGETSGPIPREAFEAYRKLAGRTPYGESVTRLIARADKVEVTDGSHRQEFPRPAADAAFPYYEGVLPKVSGPPTFCVDIDLLKSLAEALGHLPVHTGKSRMVAIWAKPGDDTYLVKTSEAGALGIIAPVRSDEERWLTSLQQIEKQIEEAKKPAPVKVHRFPAQEGSDQDTEEVSGNADSAKSA